MTETHTIVVKADISDVKRQLRSLEDFAKRMEALKVDGKFDRNRVIEKQKGRVRILTREASNLLHIHEQIEETQGKINTQYKQALATVQAVRGPKHAHRFFQERVVNPETGKMNFQDIARGDTPTGVLKFKRGLTDEAKQAYRQAAEITSISALGNVDTYDKQLRTAKRKADRLFGSDVGSVTDSIDRMVSSVTEESFLRKGGVVANNRGNPVFPDPTKQLTNEQVVSMFKANNPQASKAALNNYLKRLDNDNYFSDEFGKGKTTAQVDYRVKQSEEAFKKAKGAKDLKHMEKLRGSLEQYSKKFMHPSLLDKVQRSLDKYDTAIRVRRDKVEAAATKAATRAAKVQLEQTHDRRMGELSGKSEKQVKSELKKSLKAEQKAAKTLEKYGTEKAKTALEQATLYRKGLTTLVANKEKEAQAVSKKQKSDAEASKVKRIVDRQRDLGNKFKVAVGKKDYADIRKVEAIAAQRGKFLAKDFPQEAAKYDALSANAQSKLEGRGLGVGGGAVPRGVIEQAAKLKSLSEANTAVQAQQARLRKATVALGKEDNDVNAQAVERERKSLDLLKGSQKEFRAQAVVRRNLFTSSLQEDVKTMSVQQLKNKLLRTEKEIKEQRTKTGTSRDSYDLAILKEHEKRKGIIEKGINAKERAVSNQKIQKQKDTTSLIDSEINRLKTKQRALKKEENTRKAITEATKQSAFASKAAASIVGRRDTLLSKGSSRTAAEGSELDGLEKRYGKLRGLESSFNNIVTKNQNARDRKAKQLLNQRGQRKRKQEADDKNRARFGRKVAAEESRLAKITATNLVGLRAEASKYRAEQNRITQELRKQYNAGEKLGIAQEDMIAKSQRLAKKEREVLNLIRAQEAAESSAASLREGKIAKAVSNRYQGVDTKVGAIYSRGAAGKSSFLPTVRTQRSISLLSKELALTREKLSVLNKTKETQRNTFLIQKKKNALLQLEASLVGRIGKLQKLQGRFWGEAQRSFTQFRQVFFTALIASATFVYPMMRLIRTAGEAEKALNALNRQARFSGIFGDRAQKTVANLDIVQKGLVSIGEAGKAVRNLMRMGFTFDEAVAAAKQITEISIENKQSALTLGQALVSTTEGFRQNLSVLADAGGITKNISQINKEYADSIGKTVAQLTKRERVMALQREISIEATLASGALESVMSTLAGSVDSTSGAFTIMQQKLGLELKPAIIYITKQLKEWIKSFSDTATGVGNVTSRIGVAIFAMTKFAAVIAILAANIFLVKGVLNSFAGAIAWIIPLLIKGGAVAGFLGSAAGPIALLGLAIAGLTYYIYSEIQAMEDLTKKNREAVRPIHLVKKAVNDLGREANKNQRDLADLKASVDAFKDTGEGVDQLKSKFLQLAEVQNSAFLTGMVNADNFGTKVDKVLGIVERRMKETMRLKALAERDLIRTEIKTKEEGLRSYGSSKGNFVRSNIIAAKVLDDENFAKLPGNFTSDDSQLLERFLQSTTPEELANLRSTDTKSRTGDRLLHMVMGLSDSAFGPNVANNIKKYFRLSSRPNSSPGYGPADPVPGSNRQYANRPKVLEVLYSLMERYTEEARQGEIKNLEELRSRLELTNKIIAGRVFKTSGLSSGEEVTEDTTKEDLETTLKKFKTFENLTAANLEMQTRLSITVNNLPKGTPKEKKSFYSSLIEALRGPDNEIELTREEISNLTEEEVEIAEQVKKLLIAREKVREAREKQDAKNSKRRDERLGRDLAAYSNLEDLVKDKGKEIKGLETEIKMQYEIQDLNEELNKAEEGGKASIQAQIQNLQRKQKLGRIVNKLMGEAIRHEDTTAEMTFYKDRKTEEQIKEHLKNVQALIAVKQKRLKLAKSLGVIDKQHIEILEKQISDREKEVKHYRAQLADKQVQNRAYTQILEKEKALNEKYRNRIIQVFERIKLRSQLSKLLEKAQTDPAKNRIKNKISTFDEKNRRGIQNLSDLKSYGIGGGIRELEAEKEAVDKLRERITKDTSINRKSEEAQLKDSGDRLIQIDQQIANERIRITQQTANTMKETWTSGFADIIKGTKTWGDMLYDVFAGIMDRLNKLVMERAIEESFLGNLFDSIAGSVTKGGLGGADGMPSYLSPSLSKVGGGDIHINIEGDVMDPEAMVEKRMAPAIQKVVYDTGRKTNLFKGN